jgi:hypothetical protein
MGTLGQARRTTEHNRFVLNRLISTARLLAGDNGIGVKRYSIDNGQTTGHAGINTGEMTEHAGFNLSV